jgi:prevent-host-death family protein
MYTLKHKIVWRYEYIWRTIGESVMKKISATEFKSRCLSVLDGVRSTGDPVLITQHGKTVAKLVPVEEAPREFLGRLKGKVKILGDIESSIELPGKWKESR